MFSYAAPPSSSRKASWMWCDVRGICLAAVLGIAAVLAVAVMVYFSGGKYCYINYHAYRNDSHNFMVFEFA